MNTRLTTLPLALAITLLLILAGCGGSTSTSGGSASTNSSATTSASGTASQTAAGFTASVDAICDQRNKTVAAAGTTVETEKQLKDIAKARANAESTALAQLSKLTPPATAEPTWQQLLKDRQTLIQYWAIVGKYALQDRSKGAFGKAAATERNMLATAKHQDYTACTQPD
jgi:hypothetical protein